jgi:NADPH:quinone reductase-like Zn-dependent oxidoreductase
MAQMMETGRIRPVLDRAFPLAELANAHRYLERRQGSGKVVVTV